MSRAEVHYCPYCERVWLCFGDCGAPGDGLLPCGACGTEKYITPTLDELNRSHAVSGPGPDTSSPRAERLRKESAVAEGQELSNQEEP